MAAEALMGVHGAGLANVLWMPPGGALLELLPPLCASISYWAIAAPLQLTYHHLVCQDPEFGAVHSTGRRHDVVTTVVGLCAVGAVRAETGSTIPVIHRLADR